MLEKIFHRDPPLPPGFVSGKDKKTGEETYGVAPEFINAHRTPLEMPVKPEYQIITGVELLGAPQVIIHEEMAASPRNLSLPTLTQLEDEKYYRENLMRREVKSKIGEEKQISSPIEIRPFADNIFIFPAVMAQYAYGVQSIGAKRNKLEIKDSAPRSVQKGKIVFGKPAEDNLEGLAYVAHLRIPLDLSGYFKSPKDLQDFKGEIPLSMDIPTDGKITKTIAIFQEIFQPKLERIGEKVADLRGKSIRGVLLSPITVKYRMHDSIMTVAPDPAGEMVIAASYLV